MSDTPKISIVAPMYNVSPYLRECLDSLLKQTFVDFEAILIDDGSPDDSGVIADEYASKDSRFKVIHKNNGGVSAARNDGLAAAIGEYVFLLDSDDYLAVDALEKLYSETDNGRIDVVLSDYVAFSNASKTVYRVANKPFISTERKMLDTVQLAVFNMGPANIACGEIHMLRGVGAAWHYLIKRSVIADNEISFDPSLKGLFDDGCFTLNVLQAAKSIAYAQAPTYYYRHVAGSITRRFGGAPFGKYEAIYGTIQSFLNEFNKDDKFKRALCLRKFIYLNKSMETYFFNSQNPATEDELYREFVNLVESPIYAGAFSQVDASALGCKKSSLLLWALKHKAYRLYWLAKKYVIARGK